MQATAKALSFTTLERGSEERRATRGVHLGRTLTLDPGPPSRDVLPRPLTLAEPPAYELPRDTLVIRLSAVLGSLGWTSREKELHQKWRAQTATAILMAALSPRVARDLAASGWLQRHSAAGRHRVGPVTHPYDVLEAFRAVVDLPDSLARDRTFLEGALGVLLRRHAEEISRAGCVDFSFEAEAREYFVRGARLERALKGMTNRDARFDLLQEIHDCWYHVRNYHVFSVLSREPMAADGKSFMMFCQAAHSLARIDWDGAVRATPVGNRLPTRREVAFLVRRDRALQARCAADSALLAQVKALVASFRP